MNGAAVIFVGEDLDVLLELSDRILVIGSGRVTGIVDARSVTKEEIGLLMTKSAVNMDGKIDLALMNAAIRLHASRFRLCGIV